MNNRQVPQTVNDLWELGFHYGWLAMENKSRVVIKIKHLLMND